MTDMPKTQYAVQLVGPNELVLNTNKPVFCPGAHQMVGQVEAVGLCFSDLKLLRQFSGHVRKSAVVSGIAPAVLEEIPSYVPGDKPAVPGHEVVVRIVATGPGVTGCTVGRRFLVQTDYRWLQTADSNAAFGYNFEGALQQYVLMDERVTTSPDGQSMLLDVKEELSASAIALVEPWACVEDAYASTERTTLKAGGRMLVVADVEVPAGVVRHLMDRYGPVGRVTWLGGAAVPDDPGVPTDTIENLALVPDAGMDDVLYFGANPETIEALFAKIAAHGLLNIVQCGERFGRDVVTMIGRVHYGGIRIIGTPGSDPCDAMAIIPETDEIRPGDRIHVIGAGGPMGMMHVIRNICQGVPDVSVFAGDLDDNRLAMLTRIAQPLARKNGVTYEPYNPTKDQSPGEFDYTALMAPVPALVAQSVNQSAARGLINIFAGIPAAVTGRIDLDAYVARGLYFIGTSGSTLDDMKRMLDKVQTGRLDTNVSVAAVSGMAGATGGIRAVEDRSIAGKVIVYPACRELGLVTLEQMPARMPDVAAALDDGLWTAAAERILLDTYGCRL